jgi:hypothetical protein
MKWIDLVFKSREQRMIDQLHKQLESGIATMKDAKHTIEYQSKVIAELTVEILRLQQKLKGNTDDEDSGFQQSEEDSR